MHKALKRHIRMLMNLWPPSLGAGIRVKRLDPDWRAIDVEMNLHRWNSNYVGTHYGGSLYSMADPFCVVMLIENLGSEHVVWHKSAGIRFRRPGRGTVTAKFRLSAEQIDEIRQSLTSSDKVEPTFSVEIKDHNGIVVAEVQKVLHIQKKEVRAGA
jgi:acyl-coenzyme A thioesterase PaaI-like protein